MTDSSAGNDTLKRRLLAGIVLGPLALFIVWYGSWPLLALLVLVGLLGFREWLRIAGYKPQWVVFGLIYLGLPLVLIWFVRAEHNGHWLALWLLVVIWACDTGAYFSGRGIGGPKLAPRISPNKTWAGLIGGAVSSGVVGAVLAGFWFPKQIVHYAITACLVAVISQMGDLAESAFKRRFGVKDSGHSIPGHGGILDRFDSIATGVLAFAIVMLVEFLILQGGKALSDV